MSSARLPLIDNKKCRIVLIDDSKLTLRSLQRFIDAQPDMAVAGVSTDGAAGLELVRRTEPDLLVLDLEMNGMNGIEVLRALRDERPGLPVLVFSAVSQRGAAITVEALMEGARDYLTKPSSLSPGSTPDMVLTHLATKIRALTRDCRTTAVRPVRTRPAGGRANRMAHRPDVVVIGGSTGAPEALATLLPKLPSSLPVPIVIAVHMPAGFTATMAKSLDRRCALRVRESVDGESVTAGTVWLAAGGHHLELAKAPGTSTAVLKMNDRPPVNFCRPSVDVLYESAAAVFANRVLALQLTGMGKDGLAGAARISECGGTVFVQDRASSVVWGMPGAVTEAGLADEVLHIDALAARVQDLCTRPRLHD